MTVNEAAYVPAGPGSVNLETGDYKLEATDASISAGNADLSVSRVYDSRSPTRGYNGPFGEGWTLSVPDSGVAQWQDLTPLEDGGVTLTAADGQQATFAANGSGFVPPAGFESDTLTKLATSPVTYKLSDAAGNATTFEQPSGGGSFMPKTVVQATGAGGLNPVSYSFKTTIKGITEPTQVLGPVPANVSCSTKLEPGCRALTFSYAGQTTATGEGSNESEWGEYAGRLMKVTFTSYMGGKETATVVAKYRYDKRGLLRSEWDPRISPELKTTYNYNSEGQVVGMTPPGQQEWTFTYGAISGDANPGRLLSIGRYNPRLAKTAHITMAYDVPVSGSGAPYEMGSTKVAEWGQSDPPMDATAIFPPDEVPADPPTGYKRASVYYLDSEDRTVNVAQPSSGSTTDISTTEYDASNNVVRTLSPANRELALSDGSKSAEESDLLDTKSEYNPEEPSTGLPAEAELTNVLGPQHTVKLASGTQVEARDNTHYTYDQGAPSGGPYYLVTTTTEGAKYSGGETDVRTTTKSYGGQENLGWKLHTPTSTTTDPSGLKLVHTTLYEPNTGNVVETRMPAGASGGSSAPGYSLQFGSEGKEKEKFGVIGQDAVNSAGDVYVTDWKYDRIEEFSSSGAFIKEFGAEGTAEGKLNGPYGIAINKSTGIVYVADEKNNRVDEFKENGEYVGKLGSAGSGKGQFSKPTNLTIDSNGNIWVVDLGHNRVEEFKENGEAINEFGSEGKGNGQFIGPEGITVSDGNLYVVDHGNDRVQEFSTAGVYLGQFGSEGKGNGQFKGPYGIATDPASGDLYVVDGGNDRVQEFSPPGTFLAEFGSEGKGNGQFMVPTGLAVNNNGDAYVVDLGNVRVQEFVPPTTGNTGAHDTQTIYYAAGTNPTVAACGGHPEWANLPCQTQPVAQPEDTLPNLPITTVTYNALDEPEVATETVGSSTKTTTDTYDNSGRLTSSQITSTSGEALPKITYGYNKETGALETQSTTTGGKTKTITNLYNALGQLASYTDADENTATYTYDIDGRLEETSQAKGSEGKASQTYSYDATTGLLTKLVDSGAGTFTASYDAEGKMTSEGYPNGMTASYAYNQAGEPTGLEYVKTTHCTTGCTWLSESVVPSIHGQWLAQTQNNQILGERTNAYTYDAAQRLTKVEETPAGKGCTTRIYAYDEDTNRTSLTTREPGSEGKCATSGGTVESHSYDSADRLTDSGITYNTWGDTQNLPGADAGGKYLSTGPYYTDNQVAKQTQNGQTIEYKLDPTHRTREILLSGTTSAEIIEHYNSEGDSPSWTKNITTGTTTRYIQGMGGGLAAIQTNSEPSMLQLTDLHGDIAATASLSETATKLLTAENTTEYGVPTTSTPAKYSWLGAEQRPTELPSGVIAMGARSYVPQLGRFLQTDPQPGGSANAYAYTDGDPINSSDPSGEWTLHATSGGLSAVGTGPGQNLAEGHSIAPGAIMPPPVNQQIQSEFDEFASIAGTDPCIGELGVCIAFLWNDGPDVQIHFSENDSLYITRIGSTAAATWVAAILVAAEQPELAAVAAGAIAGFDLASEKYVKKHNCIGMEIEPFSPRVSIGYYRSRSECG